MSMPMDELLTGNFFNDAAWSMFTVVFLVWALIWMFNALKVSCNLKGGRLGGVYPVSVIGGDILCRILISSLY